MTATPRGDGRQRQFRTLCVGALCPLLACASGPDRLAAPGGEAPVVVTVDGIYPADLADLMDIGSGRFGWSWRSPTSSRPRPATLVVDGRRWCWRLDTCASSPGLPPLIHLDPDDPDAWHGMETRTAGHAPGAWLPLARQAVRSPYYPDLLGLLQALITPRFGQRVCHWYRRPVPVGAGTAVSGAVDLATCLEAATETWNQAAGTPLFAWAPDTALGVRLLHLPGQQLRPPMSASLVQRDAQGRALRLQIRIGDTYDDPVDVRYVRRGFVHELAHALLLWGHSLDRQHVLWRCGPIVDRPSADEVRAVRLLQALPAGMDVSGYDRSTELDPPGDER